MPLDLEKIISTLCSVRTPHCDQQKKNLIAFAITFLFHPHPKIRLCELEHPSFDDLVILGQLQTETVITIINDPAAASKHSQINHLLEKAIAFSERREWRVACENILLRDILSFRQYAAEAAYNKFFPRAESTTTEPLLMTLRHIQNNNGPDQRELGFRYYYAPTPVSERQAREIIDPKGLSNLGYVIFPHEVKTTTSHQIIDITVMNEKEYERYFLTRRNLLDTEHTIEPPSPVKSSEEIGIPNLPANNTFVSESLLAPSHERTTAVIPAAHSATAPSGPFYPHAPMGNHRLRRVVPTTTETNTSSPHIDSEPSTWNCCMRPRR